MYIQGLSLREPRSATATLGAVLTVIDDAEEESSILVIAFGASADAVAFLIVTGTGAGAPFRQCQYERPVGKPFADTEGVDRPHRFNPELPSPALISERAVDEPVGQDPFAFFDCRANDLVDMIGSGCCEKQRFGLGAPTVVIARQQQLADLLGTVAPTRFTGDDDLDAAVTQGIGERLHLRRLAGPLPAFEADESTAAAHAIPNSDLRPIQMRPKKPAFPTSSPATSGTTWGPVSTVVITRSAI